MPASVCATTALRTTAITTTVCERPLAYPPQYRESHLKTTEMDYENCVVVSWFYRRPKDVERGCFTHTKVFFGSS